MTDRLDGARRGSGRTKPVVAEAGHAARLRARQRSSRSPATSGAATLAVTAHGLVEVFLNGERVGDDELVPGFTSYRKRLQVFTYDVAELLRRRREPRRGAAERRLVPRPARVRAPGRRIRRRDRAASLAIEAGRGAAS